MAKKQTFAGMTYDPKTGKFTYKPMTDIDIQRQVGNEVNPEYYAGQAALQNQFTQNKLGLLNQQQGVMNQYKTDVNSLDESAKQASEAASQNSLDTGMARSSYALNAQDHVRANRLKSLAGLVANRNANVGNINAARAGARAEYNTGMMQLGAQRNANAIARKNELTQGELGRLMDIWKWNKQVSKK